MTIRVQSILVLFPFILLNPIAKGININNGKKYLGKTPWIGFNCPIGVQVNNKTKYVPQYIINETILINKGISDIGGQNLNP